MASPSRKRRRPASASIPESPTPARDGTTDSPTAARDGAPDSPTPARGGAPDSPTPRRDRTSGSALSRSEAMRRGYARSREREELVRAQLQPLAPGERPRPIAVASVVALAFAIANVAAALAGADLSSEQNDPAALTAVTTAILVVVAIGMWLRRYWAVLVFQVILALQVIVFSLALVRVQKWWLGIGTATAIGLLTWLFWKLIRAMARLQTPPRAERPSPDGPEGRCEPTR